MSGPLLAQFDLNLYVMRVLAIAGGAAVGFVVLGGLVRFLGKFVFLKKLPRPIDVLVRVLGATAGALLVWYWLAGGGGGGMGGSGWWPFGSAGGGGGGTVQPTTPVPKPPDATGTARGEAVEVEMLGGADVRDQRFYRIAGEAEALTFAEVTRNVADRRQKNPAVKVLRLVVRKESVDQHHVAVTQLERWARDSGLTPEKSTP